MSSSEFDRELETLYSRLRQNPALPANAYRHLYEITGRMMQERYGPASDFNYCSVPSISAVVLDMARQIAPCRILNVGMGGYPFVDIELKKKGFSVTGIEYSESLTVLAQKVSIHQGSPVQGIVADGVNLPFGDGCFEACLCSETVEHVPDDAAVIREIYRILKPGGILLFTVPCILGLNGLTNRLVNYLRRGSLITHPTHLREYTYFSARRLVREYFCIQRWYHVPFVTESFRKMPYEKLLSILVSLPMLKNFSLSMAFVLKRRDRVRC
jgi:SAM-dependent methyltransferase